MEKCRHLSSNSPCGSHEQTQLVYCVQIWGLGFFRRTENKRLFTLEPIDNKHLIRIYFHFLGEMPGLTFISKTGATPTGEGFLSEKVVVTVDEKDENNDEEEAQADVGHGSKGGLRPLQEDLGSGLPIGCILPSSRASAVHTSRWLFVVAASEAARGVTGRRTGPGQRWGGGEGDGTGGKGALLVHG